MNIIATRHVTTTWLCVCVCVCLYRCRDSAVGIANRYGLDGPGIESQCERDFPPPSRPALELTQSPIQMVPRVFSGGKAAEAWC